MLVVALLDELAKSRNTGILELSPEDEVGGEMLYLQNKLVDNAVLINHSCGDLLGKIVQKLPLELDALKKQRWDLVLVNQCLHEIREAKKRGRKERKHKEALAVLAAATAAAAASPRNPLLRKDSNDENPQNVSTLSARASGHPPLGPQVKETPTPSFVKVSPEKYSGIPECSKENELSCEICRRPEILLNRIFVCSSCKVAVHLDCYHKLKDPIGPSKCELCEEMSQSGSPRNIVAQCWLCGGGSSGTFRKSTNGQWVHAFCAEWLLESAFRKGQLNHANGMDAITKEKDFLTRSICHKKYGVCSKCSYGNCQITFHPLCARLAGLYMNVKAIGGKLHHKAYCEKHSLEQRRKADKQQYGAEELKNIKQIRVEVEKARLLCERIMKREKVKYAKSFHKEVVMNSHQASMQNQRLPKGFAYVPVGYLAKEKPIIHDSESHEPEEPGG